MPIYSQITKEKCLDCGHEQVKEDRERDQVSHCKECGSVNLWGMKENQNI